MFARALALGVAAVHFAAAQNSCSVPPDRRSPEAIREHFQIRLEKQEEQLRAASTAHHRHLALPWAANAAYETGDLPKAAAYAGELVRIAEDTPMEERKRHDYGMIVFYGHMVAGRIALNLGDVVSARSELLRSGQTPGSAVLNSFGPSMALANELISRPGANQIDRETALKFLDECRSFWKPEILDCWSRQLQAGEIPAFGMALHR